MFVFNKSRNVTSTQCFFSFNIKIGDIEDVAHCTILDKDVWTKFSKSWNFVGKLQLSLLNKKCAERPIF